MNDQPLPASIPSEAAVVGSMLLDVNVIPEVVQVVSSEDFYDPKHAAIFRTIVNLWDESQAVDLTLLHDELNKRDLLDDAGGFEYLLEVARSVPSTSTATVYAGNVRDSAIKRGLIAAAHKISQAAHTSPKPAIEQAGQADHLIAGIVEQANCGTEPVTVGELLQQTYTHQEDMDGHGPQGIPTGLHDLDYLIFGLQKGELTILAARPSIGKSALAIQISLHAADNGKTPTLFASMEMGKRSIGQRIFSLWGNTSLTNMRRNSLTAEEFSSMSKATGRAADIPLGIQELSDKTIVSLRALTRHYRRRNNLGLLVVDYLGLLQAPGAENRNNEVASITAGLKSLAVELDIAVLCLSQLNRVPTTRSNKKPTLADLRDSGAIEQDADVVLFLHREDYYHQGEDGYAPTQEADLDVAKNRNGPTGTVKLHFDAPRATFHSMEYSGG